MSIHNSVFLPPRWQNTKSIPPLMTLSKDPNIHALTSTSCDHAACTTQTRCSNSSRSWQLFIGAIPRACSLCIGFSVTAASCPSGCTICSQSHRAAGCGLASSACQGPRCTASSHESSHCANYTCHGAECHGASQQLMPVFICAVSWRHQAATVKGVVGGHSLLSWRSSFLILSASPAQPKESPVFATPRVTYLMRPHLASLAVRSTTSCGMEFASHFNNIHACRLPSTSTSNM